MVISGRLSASRHPAVISPDMSLVGRVRDKCRFKGQGSTAPALSTAQIASTVTRSGSSSINPANNALTSNSGIWPLKRTSISKFSCLHPGFNFCCSGASTMPRWKISDTVMVSRRTSRFRAHLARAQRKWCEDSEVGRSDRSMCTWRAACANVCRGSGSRRSPGNVGGCGTSIGVKGSSNPPSTSLQRHW